MRERERSSVIFKRDERELNRQREGEKKRGVREREKCFTLTLSAKKTAQLGLTSPRYID